VSSALVALARSAEVPGRRGGKSFSTAFEADADGTVLLGATFL